MTPQQKARVGERFYRADTSGKVPGTGLGMTIVENLVKKTLGGTLHVASTLGVGTRLHIRLPQSAPADLDTGLGEGI